MQKDYMGMAQGQTDDRAAIIENLTQLAQAAGIIDELGQEEFNKKLNELVDLIMAEDQEAVENNDLYQSIMGMLAEAQNMSEQQGSPIPQAGPNAPKDFASMMPPTPGGGGMNGR